MYIGIRFLRSEIVRFHIIILYKSIRLIIDPLRV